ncbi:MAG TPA: adenylosuccinate synthase [Bacteroidales bacterium]|nr:adenylosuccinate synthase [Bacteroidales bacterium]
MKIDVLLGLQWGDEGKGKIVDVLTPEYDIIARFQGGPNAGHTIIFEEKKFVLHTIPSGIFSEKAMNVVGNGVILDPFILKKEIDNLRKNDVAVYDNLYISRKAHLITPSHRLLDAVYERSKGIAKIGSTLKGIGPTYTDKVARQGLRIGDIKDKRFRDSYDRMRENHMRIAGSYGFSAGDFEFDGLSFSDYEAAWFDALGIFDKLKFANTEYMINNALSQGKKILAEGAQGSMLDIDFGTYPFVTSSNTICAGVCSGLGVAPKTIGEVFGVFKAYCTRVGSGPFPSELFDENGDLMRETGHEFGSTTGRPRRCGWLDLVALKYAIMLNGVTKLFMMKTDVLSPFDELNICTAYEINDQISQEVPYDMTSYEVKPVYRRMKGWNSPVENLTSIGQAPEELDDYIGFIEKETGVPIDIVSIGPDRKQTLFTK